MRKHAGCSRCKEYYEKGSYKNFEFAICDRCGRLLVGMRKDEKESAKQKVLPHPRGISADNLLI